MDPEQEFLGEFLDEIGAGNLALPTLPEVALRVRDIATSDAATAQQLANAVRADAALSGRLLQAANSPLYRGGSPIESIQTAITRLGLRAVRNLVTAIVMEQVYQAGSTQPIRAQLTELWRHNSNVAALAHVLAAKFTKLQTDEALLAGLMHDIGILPILMRAETYPGLLEHPGALEHLVERLHTMIGATLLSEWNFPNELVAVAYEHEDLDRSSPGDAPDLVDVVAVANLHSRRGNDHRHSRVDWSTIPAFAKLGLTPEESIAAMHEARAEVQAIERVLR